MDMEKLKPWNWFKHEDQSTHQIPVSRNEVTNNTRENTKTLTTPEHQAFGSLLQFHQEMDRLFDNVWRSFGMPSNTTSERTLGNTLFENSTLGNYRANLDVSGDETEYEIFIDLPGLSEEDIDIELNGNTLTIKGQKEEKSETKDKQYYRVERSMGAFQRTLSLPDDADRNDISASMKNGLLMIKIPRRAVPKEDVKRISISQ